MIFLNLIIFIYYLILNKAIYLFIYKEKKILQIISISQDEEILGNNKLISYFVCLIYLEG